MMMMTMMIRMMMIPNKHSPIGSYVRGRTRVSTKV
jgi:hypothetical protein